MRTITILFIIFCFVSIISCKKDHSCESCVTGNRQPIANAGSDVTIVLPQDSILLNGTASHDPDGTISSFQWTKISGPSSFLINNQSASTTIVKNLVDGTYQFVLKVTDNGGLSDVDTVIISVNTAVNRPPVANAGNNNTFRLPTNTIVLYGNGSTDPDNNITAYKWRKISGPSSFNIIFPDSVATQVVNLVQGVYEFELKVTDAGNLSSLDTVMVTVNPALMCGDNRPVITTQSTLIGHLSLPRSGMAIASAGNKILFAGGYTDSYPDSWGTSRVDIYDIATNTWSTTELSVARYSITAIAAGNKIFFAGGQSGELGDVTLAYHSTIDIYDASTNSWSVANLSEHVIGIAAAAIGNKVFFAGGFGTNTIGNIIHYGYTSNTVDIYDINTGAWSQSVLPRPRAWGITVAMNNKIYVAGGGYQGMYSIIDVFDNFSNTWSTSSLSKPKSDFGGIAVDNKIFWGGGYDGQGRICEVEIMDPNNQSTTFDHLSSPIYIQEFLKDNKILFYNYKDKLDIYDVNSNTWSIGTLTISQQFAEAIVVNNVMYLGGGVKNNNTTLADEVWKVDF